MARGEGGRKWRSGGGEPSNSQRSHSAIEAVSNFWISLAILRKDFLNFRMAGGGAKAKAKIGKKQEEKRKDKIVSTD